MISRSQLLKAHIVLSDDSWRGKILSIVEACWEFFEIAVLAFALRWNFNFNLLSKPAPILAAVLFSANTSFTPRFCFVFECIFNLVVAEREFPCWRRFGLFWTESNFCRILALSSLNRKNTSCFDFNTNWFSFVIHWSQKRRGFYEFTTIPHDCGLLMGLPRMKTKQLLRVFNVSNMFFILAYKCSW